MTPTAFLERLASEGKEVVDLLIAQLELRMFNVCCGHNKGKDKRREREIKLIEN